MRSTSAAALAAILGGSTLARAEPARRPIVEALEVESPKCLEKPALATALGGWLGGGDLDARVAIAVRESEGGASFKVFREGASIGERELHLEGKSCEDKRAAVALAIAVALDATLLASLGGVAKAPPPSPPLAPAPPPSALPPAPPPMPPRATSPTPRLGIAVGVDAEALVGVLPSVALAAAPAIDFSFGDTFGARLGAIATSKVTIGVAPGQASTQLAAARMDVCAGRALSVFRARVCLGAFGGPVATSGQGFARSFSTNAAMVDASLRGEGEYRVTSWFAMNVGLDAFLPAVRPRLDVVDGDGNRTSSRSLPPAGFGVSLGPAIKIW